jgi:hypothetical protein
MIGNNKERWIELCEQAANEQDPVKRLVEFVQEINRLLEAKEHRLTSNASSDESKLRIDPS